MEEPFESQAASTYQPIGLDNTSSQPFDQHTSALSGHSILNSAAQENVPSAGNTAAMNGTDTEPSESQLNDSSHKGHSFVANQSSDLTHSNGPSQQPQGFDATLQSMPEDNFAPHDPSFGDASQQGFDAATAQNDFEPLSTNNQNDMEGGAAQQQSAFEPAPGDDDNNETGSFTMDDIESAISFNPAPVEGEVAPVMDAFSNQSSSNAPVASLDPSNPGPSMNPADVEPISFQSNAIDVHGGPAVSQSNMQMVADQSLTSAASMGGTAAPTYAQSQNGSHAMNNSGGSPPNVFSRPVDDVEIIDVSDGNGNGSSSDGGRKRKWPMQEGNSRSAPGVAAAQASALARAQHMPGWMNYTQHAAPQQQPMMSRPPAYPMTNQQPKYVQRQSRQPMLEPVYISMNSGYVPTWKKMVPRGFLAARKQREQHASQKKCYALSVLNVSEFTISGVSPDGYSEPTSIKGLRSHIRQVSREYGKPAFERDTDSIDGGKWRIPLGAYQAFYILLTSLPNTVVHGIPAAHLNIAMLGRQRLEKGYPSVEKLVHIGVPKKIADTLAPFQRGGVDFVHERNGRALIADEMGLGKTIQAIASLAIYHDEWPVLVLSPSGARYHWQNEFLNWLGEDNKDKVVLDFGNEGAQGGEGDLPHDYADFAASPRRQPMPPLRESQINVLTSGNSPLLPTPDTKVVIMSYGLAPKLAEDKKLVPGMFPCAIVDESHMLKNKNSKRTKELMPVLSATNRCVLLSGTPAFARPMEIWPQVKILGSNEESSLTNEDEFVRKYVKGQTKSRRAELHTLLTGTLMIRRMKSDILKSLPSKLREQALCNVLTEQTKEEFRNYLDALKQGKGALANIARKHKAELKDDDNIPSDAPVPPKQEVQRIRSSEELKQQVEEEVQELFNQKTAEIDQYYANHQQMQQADPNMLQMARLQSLNGLRADIDKFYHVRLNELKQENVPSASAGSGDSVEPTSRKAALIQMYKKTGQVKIPLVAEMLKLWLDNPAKGKLCIFAHHISVLNEIGNIAELSNAKDSTKKFIRIDGSTNPKQRQEQINSFQKDPSVRIALLGITAAGVAVTLTASSTVWFAELFWTPALLVQAEDRCHRIGQQARVRCMYFVAKGTLDEILWKHVEKKFRDLGEFVEGKEKMRIVVHKKYRGSAELRKSIEVDDVDIDDDFDQDPDEMESAEQLENELHDDIEELEREEQELMKTPDEDDDAEESNPKPNGAKQPTVGSSEVEAICLSDDEEEDAIPVRKPLMEEGLKIDREFPELKLYRMRFPAPSCGLEVALHKGRVVVTGKAEGSSLGPNHKPYVGDLLIACNNEEVAPNVRLAPLLQHFSNLMGANGSIELMFAEEKEFADYFKANTGKPEFVKDAYMGEAGSLNIHSSIPNLQKYTLTYEGAGDYGFGVEQVNSAIVVTTLNKNRMPAIGPEDKPQVGDILATINGTTLRAGLTADSVKNVLASLKQQGSAVQMVFAAADDQIATFVASREAAKAKQAAAKKANPGGQEVIELLED